MADRTCQMCGKSFARPYLLRRHVEGRRKCVGSIFTVTDPKLACQYCHKQFSRSDAKTRHESTSCRRVPNPPAEAPGSELTPEEMGKQLAELQAQMKALMAGGGAMAPAVLGPSQGGATMVNHGQVAITNNTQVVNNNIVIYNIVGPADVGRDRLTADDLLEELRALPSDVSAAELHAALIRRVYGRGPETICFYAPNKKEPSLMVVRDSKWIQEQADVALVAVNLKPIDMLYDLGSEIKSPKHTGKPWSEADWETYDKACDALIPYHRAIRGYAKTDELKKEDKAVKAKLHGVHGTAFGVAIENTNTLRRDAARLPKPGDPARLEIYETAVGAPAPAPMASTSSATGDA